MRKQRILFDPDSEAWKLNVHLTRFTNEVFDRSLRPSRMLHEAIVAAEDSGYSHDEMRLAFWTVRCLANDTWLKKVLQEDMSPDIILRHKGHINPKTGEPAKRWLDELISRANETSPVLVGAVLSRLPADMIPGERELLKRMAVSFEE